MPPTDKKCRDRYRDCYRRMEKTEKDVCAIDKPEKGALANMPTWRFILRSLGISFLLITGSYAYTAKVAETQRELVTKGDQNYKERCEENYKCK